MTIFWELTTKKTPLCFIALQKLKNNFQQFPQIVEIGAVRGHAHVGPRFPKIAATNKNQNKTLLTGFPGNSLKD